MSCTLDIVCDDLVGLRGSARTIRLLPQALELDAPERDEGGCCDLRFRILGIYLAGWERGFESLLPTTSNRL